MENVWKDLFVSKAAYVTEGTFGKRLLDNVLAFPATFKVSPVLPLLAVAAAFFRRKVWLVAGTALTVLVMLPTQIYPHRVVYLLPYMIGLVGEAFRVLQDWPSQATSTRLRWVLLGSAMVWAVGLSLIARPVMAWSQRSERAPNRLAETAEKMLGPRERNVSLARGSSTMLAAA